MRSSQRRAGFTLVEVMIAVAVISVGASAFMMMHKASSFAVDNGREHSLGVAFQETWVERVRRDGLKWAQGSGAAGLELTDYMKSANRTGNWFVPTTVQTTLESHGADGFGRDTDRASDMRYCVNLRIDSAFPRVGDPTELRVLVRVWWHRRDGGLQQALPINTGTGCQSIPDDPSMRLVNKTVTYTMVRPL